MEKVYFSKLFKEGQNEYDTKQTLFVKSTFSDNAIELIIYDTESSSTFKGKLEAEQLTYIANQLDIPFNDFVDECKEAITAKVIHPIYNYHLEKNCFRLIKKQTFAINLLEIPMKKLSCAHQLIDAVFEEFLTFRDKKETTQKQEETSSQETLQILRKCLKEKETLERSLMRKFLIILNSKKDEIHRLKQQIESENDSNEPSRTRIRQRSPESNDFDAETEEMEV